MFFSAGALGLALTAYFAFPANADGPSPTPSPTPPSPPGSSSPAPTASASPTASPTASVTPSPSPNPSSSATPSASGEPSASPSARPAPSPGASPSPSASPSPTPSPTPSEDPEVARARDAELLSNARTLAQIIDAQALVARDELVALEAEIERVATDLEQVGADIGALEAQANDRRAIRDRLVRDAFRLAASRSASALVVVSHPQREAFEDLLRSDAELRDAHARLSERAAELARVQEAVAAKQWQLRNLRDRARIIALAAANGDASKRAAEVAVLEALARDAAAAQTTLAQLVASAMSRDGVAPSTWALPVRGTITQPFGPTTFALEPPRTYQGRSYAHFHDAVDFATRLGAPVLAAAEGRVTFVGHLSDGAMVVVIAHPGSLVSVYAHLDDTFARPPVRIGDAVAAGQVIGFVGLSGITTGPHLHFAVLRGGEPIDPLSLLASR